MKQQGVPELSNRARRERWNVEFPYGWDADDLVSRRQLLRYAVMVSGALFAGTALLAGLGLARDRRQQEERAIIAADEVPEGGVHYFNYPDEDDFAILLHLENDQFVAYSGICTHLACAVYWNDEHEELVCPCHEGIFDPITGDPIAGPPNRPLPRIVLREQDGTLYAVEEILR